MQSTSGQHDCLLQDVREVSHLQRRRAVNNGHTRSEEHLTLSVVLLAEHERLAAADNLAATDLAGVALELQGNLLGGLGFLSEDRLGLSSESSLLGGIAAIALSVSGVLSLLVLGDLVDLMFTALHAVCVFLLRSVHLDNGEHV